MNQTLNEKIIRDFKWYYNNGYITARDGNACYLDYDHYVVTASGTEKHNLEQKDFTVVGMDGKAVLDFEKPSIETGAHVAALQKSGKHASVHVHSPNTVALAALFDQPGFRPNTRHLTEVLNRKWPELFRYTKVAEIPPYFDPGSKKLHNSIEHVLGYDDIVEIGHDNDEEPIVQEVERYNDIVILQRHGVLAIGETMEECMEHIVRLEHISTILLKIIQASGSLESIL